MPAQFNTITGADWRRSLRSPRPRRLANAQALKERIRAETTARGKETMQKRFIVYPGFVTSRRDGDEHYIGFAELCSLYRVNPAECVDGSREEAVRSCDVASLVPLHVSYSGDYSTPARPRIPVDFWAVPSHRSSNVAHAYVNGAAICGSPLMPSHGSRWNTPGCIGCKKCVALWIASENG